MSTEQTGKRWLLPSAVALLALLALALGGTIACWFVPLNDFWGLAWLAERLRVYDPKSWRSGFFPPGYPLLLAAHGPSGIVGFAHVVNVCVAAGSAAAVSSITGRRVWCIGAVAGVGLALWPRWFAYSLTPGPDLPAAAFAGLGLVIVHLCGQTTRNAVIGAVLVGVASMLRHHALLLGVSTAAIAFLLRNRSMGVTVAISALIGAAPAVIANVFDGRSPLASAQAFNVYRNMYGIDWDTLTAHFAVPGPAALATAEPFIFLSAVVRGLTGMATAIVMQAGAIVMLRRSMLATAARSVFFSSVAYALLVAPAASSRALLPLVIPTVVLCGLALEAHSEGLRMNRVALTLAGAVLLIVLPIWIREDGGIVRRWRSVAATYARVAACAQAAGASEARQVFTDDLGLYLPSLPGQLPRSNGGWFRYDWPGYDRERPVVCTAAAACLERDVRRSGIRVLAISPLASSRAPALDAVGGKFPGTWCDGWRVARVPSDR